MSDIVYALLVALSSIAIVSLSNAAATPLERIRVQDQWMIDPSGRVRLFHGFNSVKKGPPWYNGDILNATKLKLYRDWGFNAVRLGAMWKGVAPTPEKFNSSYIAILKLIVESLADHGMYSILDMHQDVLSVFNTSTESIGYEGVPRWLIDLFPPSSNPFPWPFSAPPPCESWFKGYFIQAVSVAFQQIYDNVNGAIGFMSAFWTEVANAFKNQPGVLGYELINEPWAGDIYDKFVLLPGIAGRENLMPLYNRLNAAIRLVDEDTLIFYEPVTWGVFSSGGILGTGFESVPGGSVYNNRSVLSYHYYCWLLTQPNATYPVYERLICDEILGPDVVRTVKSDVLKIGGSSFLTEFGLCSPDGNRDSVNTVECEFVLSLADKYLQSWTYWDSGFFDGSGNVNWDVVKPFARVYARAIAGIPTKMTFALETKEFRLEYILNTSIKAPTEIFIPLIHFSNGFNVTTSSQLKWNFDQESRILSVQPSSVHLPLYEDAFVDIRSSHTKDS